MSKFRNWVISIGSNSPINFPPLKSACYDAIDIFNLISNNWKCKSDNKILLTGEFASTKNIDTALNEVLIRRSKESDRIFLYFSGHIDPDVRSITGSFISFDYCKKDNNLGINLRTLRYIVEDSISKYIIIVIDGCHSGIVAQGSKTKTPHWFYFTTGEMDSVISTKLFITAVNSGNYAYERFEKRNSDFTEAFISVAQSTLKKQRNITTGFFYEKLVEKIKQIGISPPVRSGVEIGSPIFLFSKIQNNTFDFDHKYCIPIWLKEIFYFEKQTSIVDDTCLFITDNNLPDGTILSIGQKVIKSWRVKNTGNVIWKNRFLKMIGESRGAGRIHSPALIPIKNTYPGEEIDIEVELRMPPYPSSVYAEFKMVDASGNYIFPNRKGLYIHFDVVEKQNQ